MGKLGVIHKNFSQYVPMVGHTVNWQVPTVKWKVGICTMVQQQGDNIRVS